MLGRQAQLFKHKLAISLCAEETGKRSRIFQTPFTTLNIRRKYVKKVGKFKKNHFYISTFSNFAFFKPVLTGLGFKPCGLSRRGVSQWTAGADFLLRQCESVALHRERS